MRILGAEIIVKTLIKENVDTIFGFPGSAVLNIYDQLYKYNDKIKHVLMCHEQSAAHAADGYARSTGKIGVCIATSGPGATNIVTGLATAYADSIPVVAITGNVASSILGQNGFQEINIMDITKSITKENFFITDVTKLEKTLIEAFYIANTGRKGPVLINISDNVMICKTNYKNYKIKNTIEKTHINPQNIVKAIELINYSKKPIIYAGGGIKSSNAYKELKELAEIINAPVATSLMGIDSFPEDHYLSIGMVGMFGNVDANAMIEKSDLLITLGARFSERGINRKNTNLKCKIIHIDIDKKEINKNVVSDCCIIGDIKKVLNLIIPKINHKQNINWIKKIVAVRSNRVIKDDSQELTNNSLFKSLNESLNMNTIISTEVGQHQMWTANKYIFKEPHTFITSGGMGTMGFGLSAAIGTQLGNMGKKVINIAGDRKFWNE